MAADKQETVDEQPNESSRRPESPPAAAQDKGSDVYGKSAEFLRRIDSTIRSYYRHITGLATMSALTLTILNTFFEDQLHAYIPVLNKAFGKTMTSNATIVTLLMVLLMIEVYRTVKMRELLRGLEDDRDEQRVETDGGSLPPRDQEGKFVSKEERGGSNLLLFVLAALAGYTYGSQFGSTEAMIGLFTGIALVALLVGGE